MEGNIEQAALATAEDKAADIDEPIGKQVARRIDDPNRAPLLDDEDSSAAVVGVLEAQRGAETGDPGYRLQADVVRHLGRHGGGQQCEGNYQQRFHRASLRRIFIQYIDAWGTGFRTGSHSVARWAEWDRWRIRSPGSPAATGKRPKPPHPCCGTAATPSTR